MILSPHVNIFATFTAINGMALSTIALMGFCGGQRQMKVREDIHFALACLYVIAQDKPYEIRLMISAMMMQLLAINRIIQKEDAT